MKSEERQIMFWAQLGRCCVRSFALVVVVVLVAIAGACDPDKSDKHEASKTQETKSKQVRLLKVQCPNLNTESCISLTLGGSSIVATKCPFQFKDITSELTESDKDLIEGKLRGRMLWDRDVASTAFFGHYPTLGFLADFTSYTVYYTTQTGKLHTCFAGNGHNEQLLRWPGVGYLGSGSGGSVSPHGVVAYEVFRQPANWENATIKDLDKWDDKEISRSAIIVADVEGSMKTAFELPPEDRRSFRLSEDGSTIVIAPWSAASSYKHSTPATTYVIDIQNLSIRAELKESLSRIHLNENGTRLYTSKEGKLSEIIDLSTGQREQIHWSIFLGRFDETDVASPNLAYIATMIAMFPSQTIEPGQWGTLIRTPKGFQFVFSPTREASFEPLAITNDGTLYTFGHYTLKPNEAGIYEAFDRDGKSILVSRQPAIEE